MCRAVPCRAVPCRVRIDGPRVHMQAVSSSIGSNIFDILFGLPVNTYIHI